MKIMRKLSKKIGKITQKSRQFFWRFLLALFALTIILRFIPVPFSAYMVQQKISHLGENYSLSYDWISLDKISPYMQLAVISSEDQRFSQHYGFDWQAIQKALKHNQNAKHIHGASTISQQTAKNLYLWHGQSWLRKGLEIPTTAMLELVWDKKRILEVYLNIAQFGEGIFGVEAASQHYFRKSAKNLTQAESALLAAVLPNPIIYKVNKPSKRVRNRQAWIIKQMNLLGKNYLQQL